MTPTSNDVRVMGPHGLLGTVKGWGQTTPAMAELTLADGRHLLIPTHLFQAKADGTYFLPLDAAAASTVVPLAREELEVHRRTVETGRVRVVKTVRTEEQVVDLPITRRELAIERVPIERFVSEPPAVRQEGNVTIVPVLEEVLVVEKRLMLREEVRLTMVQTESHEPRTVTLRIEEAHVERVAPPADGSGTDGRASQI